MISKRLERVAAESFKASALAQYGGIFRIEICSSGAFVYFAAIILRRET